MDPLIEIFRTFAQPAPGQEKPSEWSLIQILQDPERSNSIVVVSPFLLFPAAALTLCSPACSRPINLPVHWADIQALRLLTSAQIRAHPTLYSTFEPLEPVDFCRSEVEPCGKEADQVQINALSAALEVGIRIAYLDRSEVLGAENGGVINWVEFGEAGEEERPLTLLYR